MRQNTMEGFLLKPGESRGVHPLRLFGETICVKVAGEDTGGAYAVVEEITPPQGGPPVHLHTREDEWLYVLEGCFLVEAGGKRMEAGPGASVFLPRGIPHSFQNIGESAGRVLGVIQPAGFERFFRKMAALWEGGAPETAELLAVFEEFGVELPGPPLAGR